MFANTKGSWLFKDQLENPRNLADIEQQYERALREQKQYRPELAGWDNLIEAIIGLRNDIRAEKGWPLLEGPLTPMDIIKDRKRTLSDSALDRALGYTEGEVS